MSKTKTIKKQYQLEDGTSFLLWLKNDLMEKIKNEAATQKISASELMRRILAHAFKRG